MTTENEQGQGEAAVVAPRDPLFLKRVFEERTQQGAAALAGGDGPVSRRYASFTVDAKVCEPGMFDTDFSITLRSLRSGDELRAVEGAKSEVALGMQMARASLHAVNGTPVTGDEREFLWEALGSGGRQLVAMMYAQSGMASGDSVGKALKSLSVT